MPLTGLILLRSIGDLIESRQSVQSSHQVHSYGYFSEWYILAVRLPLCRLSCLVINLPELPTSFELEYCYLIELAVVIRPVDTVVVPAQD